MKNYLFTSESVTEGHPDKLCDAISDTILDEALRLDPLSRVACETSVTTGLVIVMGEITTKAFINMPEIVRETIREIGYISGKCDFTAESCGIIVSIDEQSSDIAMGVNSSLETKQVSSCENTTGAGDQGMMFGYATNETEEYMPYAISLANKLAYQLAKVRKENVLPYLRPDGKTQVTVEYTPDGKPVRIDTIVCSTQHSEDVTQEQLHSDVKEHVINPIIDRNMFDDQTKIYINPTGRFVIGGPHGDSGLTGRKIIVDTYGGYGRHGGGAFSGKDPTKVDRSAAYAARYVAKNIVAANLADKCEIQLSYAIGIAKPTSIHIETFGTEKVDKNKLEYAINECFDLTPDGIIEMLNLRQPIYKQTSAYGHFGRNDLDLPWERIDRVEEINIFLKERTNL